MAEDADTTETLEARLARLEAQDAKLTEAVALLARHATQRNWDAVAALIATAIGVIAVVVSGYTANLQRQQLRAQVWPRLETLNSTVTPSFFVTNVGTGPARVTGMRLEFDGTVLHSMLDLRKVAGFTEDDHLSKSSLAHGVLPAGAKLVYLEPARDVDRPRFLALLLDETKRLRITLCYCSVLDECWITVPGNIEPEPITSCPIPADERYDN